MACAFTTGTPVRLDTGAAAVRLESSWARTGTQVYEVEQACRAAGELASDLIVETQQARVWVACQSSKGKMQNGSH